MENRIIELETRLAYQEHTIEELNQILIRQQDEITTLTRVMQKLHEQVKHMSPSNLASIDQEAPPPHY